MYSNNNNNNNYNNNQKKKKVIVCVAFCNSRVGVRVSPGMLSNENVCCSCSWLRWFDRGLVWNEEDVILINLKRINSTQRRRSNWDWDEWMEAYLGFGTFPPDRPTKMASLRCSAFFTQLGHCIPGRVVWVWSLERPEHTGSRLKNIRKISAIFFLTKQPKAQKKTNKLAGKKNRRFWRFF